MTLPASGSISVDDILAELGRSAGEALSMADPALLVLAGKSAGQAISIPSDFYGKSLGGESAITAEIFSGYAFTLYGFMAPACEPFIPGLSIQRGTASVISIGSATLHGVYSGSFTNNLIFVLSGVTDPTAYDFHWRYPGNTTWNSVNISAWDQDTADTTLYRFNHGFTFPDGAYTTQGLIDNGIEIKISGGG